LGGLPNWARQTQFEPAQEGGEILKVAKPPREIIRFRRLNLIRPWPFQGPFDAIFCRNVTIYFDQATQAALWQDFARCLSPGGVLYIGHSERLSEGIRPRFDLAGMTIFRLKEPGHGIARDLGTEGESAWR
ncbi:methyltransferase domain-containing protein, partial [Thioclava sp. BHET1]